jgi:hypothetical protein
MGSTGSWIQLSALSLCLPSVYKKIAGSNEKIRHIYAQTHLIGIQCKLDHSLFFFQYSRTDDNANPNCAAACC